MSQKQEKRWLRDYEVEQATNGLITAARLRKDRIGKQFFPFHRVNRDCFYDIAEIHAGIEASRFGGNIIKPVRIKRIG